MTMISMNVNTPVENVDEDGRAPFTSTARTRNSCCAAVLGTPLDAADAELLATRFHALADPVRLRLLSLLASAEGGEVCACDLVEPLGKSQPTVSHHLKVLRNAGLIDGEKRGTWVWYSVRRDAIADLHGALAPVVS